jgi:replicative DNA helicase
MSASIVEESAFFDPKTGELLATTATRPDVPSSHQGVPEANTSLPVVHHVSEFRDRVLGELRLRLELGDEAAGGELIGFRELDEQLNVEAGRLIYLGAREGVGKTALALQMARNIALRLDASGKGGDVLYAITEMSAVQAVTRVIAAFAQVEARSLRKGVTEDVVAATERAFDLLSKSGLHIVNVAGRTIDEIDAVARQFHARHPGLRAVFVDNLTGVSPSKVRRSQGLHEYIGEIIEKLNLLAMPDLGIGCPVVVLGHLTRPERGQATRRPSGTDVAGSDKVNRWADTIILLHRREETGVESKSWSTTPFGSGPAAAVSSDASHEVLVVKNRDGVAFICDLHFIGAELRFVDPTGPTVRPYEMPSAEPAARTEFRRRMSELPAL